MDFFCLIVRYVLYLHKVKLLSCGTRLPALEDSQTGMNHHPAERVNTTLTVLSISAVQK